MQQKHSSTRDIAQSFYRAMTWLLTMARSIASYIQLAIKMSFMQEGLQCCPSHAGAIIYSGIMTAAHIQNKAHVYLFPASAANSMVIDD